MSLEEVYQLYRQIREHLTCLGHWQASRIFSPDHANRLLLVLSLASAFMLTVGSYAFDEPDLLRLVAKPSDKPFALFRLGLRPFNHLRDAPHANFAPIPPHLFFCDPLPLPITVGASTQNAEGVSG
jgi:hypothetical protein